MSQSNGGTGGEREQPLDNLPPNSWMPLIRGVPLWRSLSILLATRKALVSNQTPKERQKCYSQPSCGLVGSSTVTKRDRPMQICPFRPAQQKQAQEEQSEMPCPCSTNASLARATELPLGLTAAPAAPSTADTTSGGHTGGRLLGPGEAMEQEGRPGSNKKFSQGKLALGAPLRMHGK